MATTLKPGDVLDVVVTATKPFGSFVESDGVPGLVRGARAEQHSVIRVRVIDYDDAERRFSASIV